RRSRSQTSWLSALVSGRQRRVGPDSPGSTISETAIDATATWRSRAASIRSSTGTSFRVLAIVRRDEPGAGRADVVGDRQAGRGGAVEVQPGPAPGRERELLGEL